MKNKHSCPVTSSTHSPLDSKRTGIAYYRVTEVYKKNRQSSVTHRTCEEIKLCDPPCSHERARKASWSALQKEHRPSRGTTYTMSARINKSKCTAPFGGLNGIDRDVKLTGTTSRAPIFVMFFVLVVVCGLRGSFGGGFDSKKVGSIVTRWSNEMVSMSLMYITRRRRNDEDGGLLALLGGEREKRLRERTRIRWSGCRADRFRFRRGWAGDACLLSSSTRIRDEGR